MIRLKSPGGHGACEYCEYRAVCGPYEELRTGRKSPERLHDLRALRKLV